MMKNKRICILCILTTLVLLFLFGGACNYRNDKLNVENKPESLKFVLGMYSRDGITWGNSDAIEYDDIDDELYIRGGFNREITKDEYVFLFLKNMQVELLVNGESIYEYGYDVPSDKLLNVLGMSWEKAETIGIAVEDDCIFRIKAFSGNIIESDIESFISHIDAGTEEEMLVKLIRKDDVYLMFDLVIGVICIVLLFVSFILWALYVSDIEKQIFLCVFLLSCCTWMLVNSKAYIFMSNNSKLNYLIEVYAQYAISFVALSFVKSFVKDWRRKVFTVFQIWTVLFIIAVTMANIVQAVAFYKYMNIGAISNIIFIIWIVFSLFYEIFFMENREAKRLLISGIPIIIGGTGEIYNYISRSVYEHNVAFEIGIIGFIIFQMYYFVKNLIEQAEKTKDLAKMEAELSNNKIAIMLGQIHPHFLYNALVAIKALCEIDSKRAGEMIDRFALFLRGNMNSLTEKRRIPFEKELEHVSHYIELEKMRFGDRLHVSFDIKTKNFTIPTLTLQTIVENAVRHGILKKVEGGCVSISTEEVEGEYIIIVIDDGVGYNVDGSMDNSTEHIGLVNVKNRLTMQCNGTLEITSTIGEGTKVIMHIPKDI